MNWHVSGASELSDTAAARSSSWLLSARMAAAAAVLFCRSRSRAAPFVTVSCSLACRALISWTASQVTPATGLPPASVCASWISSGYIVATMYPLEIQLAQTLAGGKPVAGVTWDAVHEINARHAREHDTVTKGAALDLLRQNSTAAAAAIRALSNQELDRAAAVSLNSEAPLTCQFMLEDHAVRHSYHHLARIRAALTR